MYLLVKITKAFCKGIVRPTLVEIKRGLANLGPFMNYRRNFLEFERMVADRTDYLFEVNEPYPCLSDRYDSAGSARGHYFHQDLLVAQRIFSSRPSKHLDIGSRVDGFVAHVATFMEIEVLDIRPMKTSAINIRFRQADLLSSEIEKFEAVESVSCLHALEHFGLGRYGDQIDPDGWVKGLNALARLTAPGGTLYLAVPIGPSRIEFDAHRVFSVADLRGYLTERFSVLEFLYVDDSGDHHEVSLVDFFADIENFGCQYGCGIFVLQRKEA